MRGFSFSWRRALGLSAAKGKLSRAIGVPLTKSGRERKIGGMAAGAVASLAVESAATTSARSPTVSEAHAAGTSPSSVLGAVAVLGAIGAAVYYRSWAHLIVGLLAAGILSKVLERFATFRALFVVSLTGAVLFGAFYWRNWWIFFGGLVLVGGLSAALGVKLEEVEGGR